MIDGPKMHVEVGQVIYAYDDMGRKMNAERLIVSRVSRVYFYASSTGKADKWSEHAFTIAGGDERVKFGSSRTAYTEQGWAEYAASQEVRDELRTLGVEHNYGLKAYARASLSQLTRIRDILKEGL